MAGLSRVLTSHLEALQSITYCGILYLFIEAAGHTVMLNRVLGNSTPQLATSKSLPGHMEDQDRAGMGKGLLAGDPFRLSQPLPLS